MPLSYIFSASTSNTLYCTKIVIENNNATQPMKETVGRRGSGGFYERATKMDGWEWDGLRLTRVDGQRSRLAQQELSKVDGAKWRWDFETT